jgi:hypothetical protein
MLAIVRKHASKAPLPRVSSLPRPEKLEVEETNVRRCLAYAAQRLGL